MKIGQSICNARKRKRISQEELASRLEVSRQSVSLWETDQTIPTLDKLEAMCRIFDVTMDQLTGLTPLEEDIRVDEELLKKKMKLQEKENKIYGIISLILAVFSILLWQVDGLGIVISIISIVLNFVSMKVIKFKLGIYALIVSVVFLLASIFNVIYL